MGPAVGNRISAAAGVVGDANTSYAGAASGGVWKSTDKGASWAPIFDAMPVQAIGALAVSTSDPKQVWAGTGEAWAIRDVDMMGDGIYKSTDAGATWQHMGLDETGRIGRIVVHPTNANIVYVCALGRTTGPQQERGVYKTTDGGQNWTRVLFVDPNTGCSGLNIDANDPNTLFAGMWQVEMHTYGMFSGGPSQRHLCHARWRRQLDAHRRPWPPEISCWKDRRCARAFELQARLRADPNRRSRLHLAFRRWRRELGQRKLAARSDRPRRLLHQAGREPEKPG